jgi:hypothetical protein
MDQIEQKQHELLAEQLPGNYGKASKKTYIRLNIENFLYYFIYDIFSISNLPSHCSGSCVVVFHGRYNAKLFERNSGKGNSNAANPAAGNQGGYAAA